MRAHKKTSRGRMLRVAAFLAARYITRTNPWQTGLVIFVMTLTFLNLVVVNGVLVGLIDGSLAAYRTYYAGDLLISKLPEKEAIERSTSVRAALRREPRIAAWTERTIEAGTVEAHYQEHVSRPDVVPDTVGVSIAGIDVRAEDAVTNLSHAMVEGSFLAPGDDDYIVIGSNLIDRYFPAEIGFQTLARVYPGDKVRVRIGTSEREFVVKGIVRTKSDATDLRVFMLTTSLLSLSGAYGTPQVDEFAVRLTDAIHLEDVRARLLGFGLGSLALVRTNEEAIGDFIEEIRSTFSALGNIIGSISVVVASITIFIIIFITAITRQKYIGILKGIGISGATIELSYVLLSFFYASIGIAVGSALVFFFLVPYFAAHPINFPFSDGILSVTVEGTAVRSLILAATTLLAGYIPARIIVGKNTLDAILGR